MKYRAIPSEMFTKNRANLSGLLPANSFAIVHAAEHPWRSGDGSSRFIQESDLFYLTGVDQEETILLLCPGHTDPMMREILFLRPTSEQLTIWEGYKLTPKEGKMTSGISQVCSTDDFDGVLRRFAREFDTVFLATNEHPRAGVPLDFTRSDRFRERCQDLYPNHHYERLLPLLTSLRMTKSSEEIDLIQQACDITAAGFERVLKFVRPGQLEYEIEAEYLHEFTRRGSSGFAYEPIIASGNNANVLHYLSNDQVCEAGDLILMDVGAEYANYNADMTRTIPVSGTFSPRQRAVYEAVLRVLRHCIDELIVPGKAIREVYQAEVGRLMEDELIALGLLDHDEVQAERDEECPELERAYRRYFMHGTSHSLGLDVHDVTAPDAVFVENMCVTVEPGIYLPEEGFGIRLENNIIVRAEGNLDLMASIPIEPDEIEAVMQSAITPPTPTS